MLTVFFKLSNVLFDVLSFFVFKTFVLKTFVLKTIVVIIKRN